MGMLRRGIFVSQVCVVICFILFQRMGESSLNIMKCGLPSPEGGWVVQGRRVKSPSCWILTTL